MAKGCLPWDHELSPGHDRAADARRRLLRFRPRRPGDRRRLRPRGVRAQAVERRPQQDDRAHRLHPGRGGRGLPAGRGGGGRHPRGPRPAHRPRVARAAIPRARASCTTGSSASCRAGATDDGFPLKPQRVLHDLRQVLAPHDILISDVGRPQALGGPAVPGRGAQHRHHLERLRGHGHRRCPAPSRPSSCIPSGAWWPSSATAASS